MTSRLTLLLILGAFVVAGCSSASRASAVPASAIPVSSPSEHGLQADGHPASAPPTTEPSPSGRPASSIDPALDDLPSRIVIASLGIDLPIVSGDLVVPGSEPDYPLCDVAQYLTTFRYPGRAGTATWIYAHAREGMFLPLLSASERADGAALINDEVDVYSSGGRRYTYRITDVLRHATDRSHGVGVPADQRRLVLQTSEGPHGTIPKLQVVATFVAVAPAASLAEAVPPAAPRDCSH